MQTRNPILDEFAKLTTGAMGLAQAAGDEARAAFRSQSDRLVAEMDLVRRDEFDALKAEITALRAEIAALKAEKASATGQKKPGKGTSTASVPPKDAAG
ncbi:accessory factor UbiK family protein [Brevundimonas sp.]|uniref:accessory factor UbiK family protein n=1 Tax=Brevundimonas sp. TaxID=1871086 RepID=UPI003A92D687